MKNSLETWPVSPPKSILVRMPNWLGDLVMATPILADLKERWPDAKITAMCQNNVGGLLTHDPHVDELFVFRKPSGWLHRQAYRNILQPLRHGEYDLGLLLTNSFSSAWLFWRGQVKNRIGFAGNCRSFLLNKAVACPKEKEAMHQVLLYKQLLIPMGITPSDTPPKLYVSEQETTAAKDLLKKSGYQEGQALIGINPGAAFGSAKCWLPERFREVTLRLLEDPSVYIVYFGDTAGAPLVNAICAGLPPERVLNLAGKTNLRELIALIKECKVLLTNDSGPMHIGSALETPLLALFGSTSAVKTGPYNGGKIIHKNVACSPCYLRTCPIDFRCMKQISVEEVYRELCSFLKAPGTKSTK